MSTNQATRKVMQRTYQLLCNFHRVQALCDRAKFYTGTISSRRFADAYPVEHMLCRISVGWISYLCKPPPRHNACTV